MDLNPGKVVKVFKVVNVFNVDKVVKVSNQGNVCLMILWTLRQAC